MRVFISSARKDADAVARIEGALRRRNIESSSWLDLPVGEEWTRFLDEASAKADGFIFFLGDGASTSQSLSAEWRVLLQRLGIEEAADSGCDLEGRTAAGSSPCVSSQLPSARYQ